MKVFATACLFVLCLMPNASAQLSGDGEFWIPTMLKWQHTPGGPRYLKTTAAEVLYFAKDGRFVRDDCWLIKIGKEITISNGDAHNEYVGETEPILDGMHLKYRLVRRSVGIKGEELPGKEISEDASIRAVSGLSLEGVSFDESLSQMPANTRLGMPLS